jgi:hypothetical protein
MYSQLSYRHESLARQYENVTMKVAELSDRIHYKQFIVALTWFMFVASERRSAAPRKSFEPVPLDLLLDFIILSQF